MASPPSCAVLWTLFLLLIPTGSWLKGAECRFRRQAEKDVDWPPATFFIFGDSYFDAGNNNYINTSTLDQANFLPYGETFFHFPTGRFSDGRLISDFIAEQAGLPLVPPFLQPGAEENCYGNGVNFASAGAGALVETFQGWVISLRRQLSNYRKVERLWRHELGKREAKRAMSRAIYLFSIGTNDYFTLFLTNSTILPSSSHSSYVAMVIANLTTAITEVYGGGGRKFGFLNLGPLGCLPGLRILQPEDNGGCLEEASRLAELHNEALSKMLRRLASHLKGFKYSLYDFNSHARQLMNEPSKYGFKEGRTACCGTGRFRGAYSCGGRRPVKKFELCENPNEYVFWDSFHLTERAYNHMADQMWAGAPPLVKPHNLRHLFRN
ncbi:GDSL esterase/lipase 5-like [Diospyros lotus]|uniref:GDSL esterase/lipase 5-like n=1 Tax=Diospyros lotus TaxID=55363 RepID=UPI00225889AA|nr:GDSL esterase/lipase 5-like [Diospyros lotus]